MANILPVRVGTLRTLFALCAVSVPLAVPALVAAQTEAVDAVGETAGLGNAGLMETIGAIIGVVLGFMGVVFLLLLMYSGITWMTSGGDEEKVKRAKQILINATIGLVLTLSAYGIASFIIGALSDAANGNNGRGNSGTRITACLNCSSLGSGPIRDHYPDRNETDVARNARIMVTFKEAMSIESFIAGYDDAGTPTDTSDDTAATAINAANVMIFVTADGEEAALTNVNVSFTEDLKTFVFDPVEYLGSATEDVTYTVVLDNAIVNADGDRVFVGQYSDGYEWAFEVGTTIDLTPPRVVSVIPVSGGTYDRNIAVEVTFNEAIDPTSATGTRTADSGFQNIQTAGASGSPVAGTYEIANRYRTVTFTSTDACGTNSCGETIYCLPGNANMSVTAYAATVGSNAPQASALDGIVDTAANSLDGNGDGTAGDDYSWSFSTTDDINLVGPRIESINPNILEEGIALDQDIELTFTDVMRTSTVSNEHISIENVNSSTNATHEMWYVVSTESLTADGTEVSAPGQVAAKTRANVGHGVFLESTDTSSWLYSVVVGEGLQNQYQNCYSPAEGPDASGGECDVNATSPSCCNGNAQAATCDFFDTAE